MSKSVRLVIVLLALFGAVAWVALRENGGSAAQSTALEPAPTAAAAPLEAPLAPVEARPVAPPRSASLDAPAPARAAAPAPLRAGEVVGYVRDEDGLPVAGVEVSASFDLDDGQRAREVTFSDDFGRYALRLGLHGLLNHVHVGRAEALDARLDELAAELGRVGAQLERSERRRRGDSFDVLAREAPELLERLRAATSPQALRELARPPALRVAAEGGARGRDERVLALGSRVERTLRVDLVLRDRAGFAGTVLFEGQGLAEASVLLFDESWDFVAATRADQRGAFRFGDVAPGAYHVHARREGRGAGGTPVFDLGKGFHPRDVVVPASDGGGVLELRVTLPDDTPLANVEVMAVESGLAATATAPWSPDLAELARREADGGLVVAHGTTDAYGAVRLTGLRAGSYRVRVDALGDSRQPPGEAATGATTHLVLDAHLLVVLPRLRREEDLELYVPPTLELQERDAVGRAPRRYTRRIDLAGATFVVDPDTEWSVGWAGVSGWSPRDGGGVRVRIRPTPSVTEVRLYLPGDWTTERALAQPSLPAPWEACARPASARLRVRATRGTEAAPAARLSLWRVGADGALEPVVRARPVPYDDAVGPLRPGRYRWLVQDADDLTPPEPPDAAEPTLELAAGEEQRLDAHLPGVGPEPALPEGVELAAPR